MHGPSFYHSGWWITELITSIERLPVRRAYFTCPPNQVATYCNDLYWTLNRFRRIKPASHFLADNKSGVETLRNCRPLGNLCCTKLGLTLLSPKENNHYTAAI